MTHASLIMPTIEVRVLKPQPVMGRNEPCWCGSNKKWKHCHKDRDKQAPVPVFKHVHKMRERLMQGRCVHPLAGSDTCSGEPIRAHTVQRNGGLSAIAEAGHVISVLAAFQDLHKNSGVLTPRSVGVGSASTFTGFCNYHDTSMFRRVEVGTKELSVENCFLLSFRALAYELITKEAAIAALPLMRETDRGRPYDEQILAQEYLSALAVGHQLGLNDLERWKLDYDAVYVGQAFGRFNAYGVSFDRVLPVVACGAFTPEVDFNGRQLQKLGVGPAGHEAVTFNLTVFDGRSVAVLGWIGKQDGPASLFAGSYMKAVRASGANAVIKLVFEQLENTFMKPSWWSGLSPTEQSTILRHARSGTPSGGARTTAALLSEAPMFSAQVDKIASFIA
jgi:hypothetical protein